MKRIAHFTDKFAIVLSGRVSACSAWTAFDAPGLTCDAAAFSAVLGHSFIRWPFQWMVQDDDRRPGDHQRAAPRSLLLATVERELAPRIGTPGIAVYEAPEPKRLATGASKNTRWCVSTGLLHRCRRRRSKPVLGHEISHVATATW